MTTADHRREPAGQYYVRRATASATQAAADVVRHLDDGVRLVDLSTHDRRADVISMHIFTEGGTTT